METLVNIWGGVQVALHPFNVLITFSGTIMGIFFGALPGFSASMGVAVLLPVTYGMSPVSGLCLLGGIFCGAQYGGSITACLVNTPGTASAAATALDGFPLTKQGRAGEALRESAVASFWGGIISTLALLFIAPPLAKFALAFGPPEMLMLAIFGLTVIVSLSTGSVFKGLISGTIGLLTGCVGMEPNTGYMRFTFAQPSLYDGVSFVPALIGLFAASQVYSMIIEGEEGILDFDAKKIDVGRPSWKDLVRHPVVYIRSGLIGTFIGAVPAAGGSVAAFLSYNEGKRFSKHPELFGKGSLEGVASAEAANNGVTGGSLMTMMTLGIPGSETTAIMLGGLMVHGLTPGHTLFAVNTDISYGFMVSLFVANLVFLIIGMFGAKYFAYVARTPTNVLTCLIMILAVMGSFALTNNPFDIWVMFLFGILGFLLKYCNFGLSPVVLGLLLGPIAENALNQTVVLARAAKTTSLALIIGRPICVAMIVLSLISIATPLYRDIISPVLKMRKGVDAMK
jgi:putative tricarboxylic transport membrane protein